MSRPTSVSSSFETFVGDKVSSMFYEDATGDLTLIPNFTRTSSIFFWYDARFLLSIALGSK